MTGQHVSTPEPAAVGAASTTGRAPLLSISDLRVGYRVAGSSPLRAVQGVSLQVGAGEVVAVVGESGSGKSTLALAVLGLLPPNAAVTDGSITVRTRPTPTAPWTDEELTQLSERGWRSIRGGRIGLVPQDPTISLNPVRTIGSQVAEVLRAHGIADRRQAGGRTVELLAKAGLDHPEARAAQHPHELSGGMRQRVLITIATAARPSLVVADEPTSALDATVQRRILDHLEHLRAENDTGLLLITHDLGVAADRAHRIVVMSHGRIVEQGTADEVLRAPAASYTKRLIAAAPGLQFLADREPAPAVAPSTGPGPASTTAPLLAVANLTKDFVLRRSDGHRQFVRAVDDVTFDLYPGRTLALVGESGSGKSTTARLVLRLADPTSGVIRFGGSDITRLAPRRLRDLRRRAQLIYQNPYSSLNPKFDIAEVIAEPLRAFKVGSGRQQRARVAALADRVALPSSILHRRPAELSGGQRQRVAIARALALSPDLVVCDEPVSALDVSVQAQVLDLLQELQRESRLSYLFISHDLAVVRQIAHDVGVMRGGKLVELRPAADLFTHPEQEYTRELLDAIAGRRPRTVELRS